MIVAVASNRPTEIEAVKEAWKVFSESLVDKGDAVEFVSYGIAGDIRSLPLNQDELMTGARSRAESLILQLKRERAEADYYVGLQSGFQLVNSQGPVGWSSWPVGYMSRMDTKVGSAMGPVLRFPRRLPIK